MEPFDVAVVGAGLAGLHAARLLGQRGIRVLLVDRKASVADAIQTTGIFVRKTWEDFPLPDQLLGPPIREVRLYSPARRMLALTAARDEFRIGRMEGFYLWLLEQCIRAGVEWRPATRLIACHAAAGGSRLELENSGRRETVAARFVIGADGPRSLVADALGLDRNREMIVGVEDLFAGAASDSPELHCYLDPRLAPGYIAWVARDGGETHVGVGGYRERFNPAAALDEFRSSVARDHGLEGKNATERRGGLIPVGGILRRLANRRGLLVGDAAGAVSPLTAGGLDPALRLSSFAAEITRLYLESGDERVLRQYTGDRVRARFVARRFMRRALSSVHSPLAMELGCAMLRTSPFRALAAHVFFGRGSFPDLEAVRSSDWELAQ